MIWTVTRMCQIWNSFRQIYLLYWIKFVKYGKLFPIQGTGCYDTNVTFISFPKDGPPEFVKFEFWQVSSDSRIWKKKDGKVFGKNNATFWQNIAYIANSVFHYTWKLRLIAYQDHSKFRMRKCKKQHCVLRL